MRSTTAKLSETCELIDKQAYKDTHSTIVYHPQL
jgi:hypothetical protein